MATFTKNLFVTLCALSHTTERAARRRGVGYFLPALFADRFTKLGGIDKPVFEAQLEGCRTFEDMEWTAYWRACADEHLAAAGEALNRLGGPRVAELLSPAPSDVVAQLGDVLAPAAELFAERARDGVTEQVRSFIDRYPQHVDAALAVDALVRAITYLFAAAWPGWTPRRLEAYRDSRRLFDALLRALAPALGLKVELLELEEAGETCTAYVVLPADISSPTPGVLVTNGLEGTIQEVLLPMLRFRDRGIAMIAMEMPGTFGYRQPLSAESTALYRAVIDRMAAHPDIDPAKIGMVGLSFGAHWSTRMAATDSRLRAVVSNGGLYARSFKTAATWGMPEIMLWTLQKTTAARNPLDLARKLRALAIGHLYRNITIPILAINGDHDTLVSTQDTIDLANGAPLGELKLYPNDDHCAMGHYTEWLVDTIKWLEVQLQTA